MKETPLSGGDYNGSWLESSSIVSGDTLHIVDVCGPVRDHWYLVYPNGVARHVQNEPVGPALLFSSNEVKS